MLSADTPISGVVHLRSTWLPEVSVGTAYPSGPLLEMKSTTGGAAPGPAAVTHGPVNEPWFTRICRLCDEIHSSGTPSRTTLSAVARSAVNLSIDELRPSGWTASAPVRCTGSARIETRPRLTPS